MSSPTLLHPDEEPARWLAEILPSIGARRVHHPGNLRFCGRFSRVAAWSMTVAVDQQPHPLDERELYPLFLADVRRISGRSSARHTLTPLAAESLLSARGTACLQAAPYG